MTTVGSSSSNSVPRSLGDEYHGTLKIDAGAPPAPPHRYAVVDRFERKTPSQAAVDRRPPPDTGKTDQYKTLKSILDSGVRAGDDPLVDHEVEKLIHTDQKPASKADLEARDAFLKTAEKAGYDISQAPNKSNR